MSATLHIPNYTLGALEAWLLTHTTHTHTHNDCTQPSLTPLFLPLLHSNREPPASRYTELGFSPAEVEELQALNLWDEGLVALGKSITALDALLRASAAAPDADVVNAPPAPPEVPNLPPTVRSRRAPASPQAPGTVPLKTFVDTDPMLTWRPQTVEKTGITGRLQRLRRRAVLPTQALRYGFKSLGHDYNPHAARSTANKNGAIAAQAQNAGGQPGSTAAAALAAAVASMTPPPPQKYEPQPVKLEPYLRVFEPEATARNKEDSSN